MLRHLRHLCGGMAGIVLLVQALACAGAWSGLPKPASPKAMADSTRDTLPAVALESPAEGNALVYIFNVSGGTLVRSPLSVQVDGNLVTNLPREMYTTLDMAPGQHLWYVQGGRLKMAFDAGRTYYLACAFDPYGSWFWPVEGEDAKVREIDEATARVLLQTYRFQSREEARKVAAVATTGDTLPPAPLEVPAEGKALVYLFNTEGTFDFYVDGTNVAHLPEETYTTFALAPGQHLWKAHVSKLRLRADAGRIYFLALAHYPKKGLALLLDVLADEPGPSSVFELREVDEANARWMLSRYRFQAREASQSAKEATRAKTVSLERVPTSRSHP